MCVGGAEKHVFNLQFPKIEASEAHCDRLAAKKGFFMAFKNS